MNICNCNCGAMGEIGYDCTARVIIKLPAGVTPEDYSDIKLIAAQAGTNIFTKHIDELILLSETDNKYYYQITREDTRRLDPCLELSLQIWWESGQSSNSTRKIKIYVRDLLPGGDEQDA